MKLITEYTQNDIQCMVTEEKGGKKNYVIEGVFAQAEKENRNKRFYPKSVLEPAVEKFVKEQVTTNRAVGELNHPEGPTVNLDKVSHHLNFQPWFCLLLSMYHHEEGWHLKEFSSKVVYHQSHSTQT